MSSAPPESEDLSLLLAAKGITGADAQRAVREGFRVLERFLAGFNARDAVRWADTLNFPHVRITAGQVQTWASAFDYVRDNDLDAFATTGWSHSRWDRIEPVQADADKVHFALRFTRFDRNETPLASFEALYVVTRQGSGVAAKWGVQARSSYAGIAIPGAAF